MSTLSEYIKSQPEKPMREWAEAFGISRPHLIALIAGDRAPSIEVARKIERGTGGQVSVTSWPNIQAMAAALAKGA